MQTNQTNDHYSVNWTLTNMSVSFFHYSWLVYWNIAALSKEFHRYKVDVNERVESIESIKLTCRETQNPIDAR